MAGVVLACPGSGGTHATLASRPGSLGSGRQGRPVRSRADPEAPVSDRPGCRRPRQWAAFRLPALHDGPFDKAVYAELEALHSSGKVDVRGLRPRTYALTDSGRSDGTQALRELPATAGRYFKDLARWMLPLSFGDLLSAICRRYPDMAVTSVVPEMADPCAGSVHRPRMPSFLSGAARALDLGGALSEYEAVAGNEADAQALDEVWRSVGNDLRRTMADFRLPPDRVDASQGPRIGQTASHRQ